MMAALFRIRPAPVVLSQIRRLAVKTTPSLACATPKIPLLFIRGKKTKFERPKWKQQSYAPIDIHRDRVLTALDEVEEQKYWAYIIWFFPSFLVLVWFLYRMQYWSMEPPHGHDDILRIYGYDQKTDHWR